MRNVKLAPVRASVPVLAALFLGVAPILGCAGQIDRHGHVFIDVDLDQIRPGMSKADVQTVLGSPDTQSAIGGDAYYYISSTMKTVAFLKPKEIEREVVAVYFDGSDHVRDVARYGKKDGIIIDYYKGETPARGKDLNFLEQMFGNMSNRQLFKDQTGAGTSGIPGI
ncbi:outer membrane protein assembly factor BamE [Methyloceanibacter sp.]|uniref:outer membrane protein assembly factor BamE n=1 Tax=Methyloceanibacter sp. TaxID=1965321 RepID=UPI002080725D|nr:outer membrane protein assembly factor BamE [Methyloceanibacter sp.]GFO82080.1 MAG: outer membrane protein assembly factor BamE [Methyloceanibacter sp.]HML93358.1 outer membrane protein assembly factor BamE [Methyloceanibacter sp.]